MGHDSFLDIVANLVGILIILVVVLGAQSTTMIQEALDEDPNATEMKVTRDPLASEHQLQQLAGHSMRAASARADSERLEGLVERYDQELSFRKEERAVLLMLLEEANTTWREHQANLDQDQVRVAKLESEYEVAKSRLDKVESEIRRIEDAPEKIVAVEHLPTPMAKTVFNEEIHLRLKENRIAVVPLEQLIDEVKQDIERSIKGSREGEMQSAVGPIRGFVARFLMEKSSGMVNRGGQLSMATRVQVVRMTAESLTEPYGQPIEVVLAGTSDLDVELAGRDPATTTVTVWVYPDSYASFRKLKESLFQRGYATAARPLEEDGLIGVSPNGSKSNAQ